MQYIRTVDIADTAAEHLVYGASAPPFQLQQTGARRVQSAEAGMAANLLQTQLARARLLSGWTPRM